MTDDRYQTLAEGFARCSPVAQTTSAAPKVTNDRGQNQLTRGASGYDARLQWQASPGAAAYRMSWRDAWTND